MFLSHFATLAAYNRWANTRLYDACAGLSDAARKLDRRGFFGSIHNTLNHILVGDRAWLGARTHGRSSHGRRSRLPQRGGHPVPHADAPGVHASLQSFDLQATT